MSRFIVLFVFLSSIAFANDDCPPYEVLSSQDFVNDSIFILTKGKAAILEMQNKEVDELPEDALKKFEPTIQEGDLLTITVYHHSRQDWMNDVMHLNNLRGGIKVIDGKVAIPELAPTIVEGLTLKEAKEKIRDELRKEIKDADVYVKMREKKTTHSVLLSGLVAGREIPVDGNTTLFEVLSRARIVGEANLFASYVLRNDRPISVDMFKLLKDGDMSQNIIMQPGDKIYIAQASDHFIVVMGEVRAPRTIPVISGRISLRKALAIAHGIPFTGSRNHIQVIRGGICHPKIYDLSLDCILSEPNHNLLLIPGDIVYISRKPISHWNMYISELSVTLALLPYGLLIRDLCH
jgi:polysaccharide export outer membrane protein